MPPAISPPNVLSAPSASRKAKDVWLGWHPAVVGVLVFLLFAVPALAVIWNVHERAELVLEESIKSNLISAAKSIAEVVDGDTHGQFQRQDQEASAPYHQAIMHMERMKDALNTQGMIRFVYTCVQKDDQIYLVLDPTPPGDADHDGQDDKAHIMESYDEASATLRDVLVSGVAAVDTTPYTDRWGTFLSGYAPIFDSRRNVVAVVGVDMELKDYQLQLRGLHHVTRLSAIGSVFLAILAGIFMAGYHRRLQKTIGQTVIARDAALAASQAKSQFLAAMSHELRTPMNAVIGLSEILADTPLNEQQTEFVETIRRSGDSLLQMITDILDFSQLDATGITVKTTPVAPRALLAGLQEQFEPLARQKGLRIHFETSPKCPTKVLMDGDRVRQVLRHLIANAVKFTDQGSVKVHLDVTEGTSLHFKVSDTGIGIGGEQKTILFQPFNQADFTNTRRHGGMGIGLALCKKLSQAMGGRLWMNTVEGKGTDFHLVLPCRFVAEVPPQELQQAIVLTQERMTGIIVRGFLSKQGCHVRLVKSLGELEVALHQQPASLILADVHLEGVEKLPALCGGSVRVIGLNAELEDQVLPGFETILASPVTPAALKEVL
ncbi:Signal transduction histidine kinase [Prosthecobacter debontii]|uniref:Sensory/regulatory protein RpfC n=1 Tax=Prosthecobacter debontii TaxID=48467 RepID=A0A1T4XUD0_9BACT|nr:ATP-binding protein [Prosthecobacter debontii]SKA93166.1 Signal transduction histidine kinase [Prosthecobacter debontii]